MNYKYSELVKKIRNKLIISQKELALILGVSFSTVNRWENGHFYSTIKAKSKILQLCKENSIEVA